MKNLFKNTIISQAIELGFSFDKFEENSDINEIESAMFDFFNANETRLPRLEDECDVNNCGQGLQHVHYRDYESTGEIVDFSAHWADDPDTKVFHSSFLLEEDGVIKSMFLYYLVGQTMHNAPEGYYFDTKKNCHVKEF